MAQGKKHNEVKMLSIVTYEIHLKLFFKIQFYFPKMGKEIATQVQEIQRVPNRINPRRNTPRHILVKLTKIKHNEQILKAARAKQHT